MQSKSRPMEDISNLLTNAAGALKGVGDEVKAMGRSQAEKLVAELDLVSREEFDVLKARLDKALADIETLKGKKPAAKSSATKRTTAKKSTSQKPAAKTAKARKPLKNGPTKKS